MRGAGTCTCAEPKQETLSASSADTCAVIVAGGKGVRFGDPRGKQFVDLCGLPLLAWSLAAFDRAPSISQIVVVCERTRQAEVESSIVQKIQVAKPVIYADSGAERQDSVRSGLAAVPQSTRFVAVHDAARPLISVSDIELCIQTLREDVSLIGAIAAAPLTDTIKLVKNNIIEHTPDRSLYWRAETPQVFRRKELTQAHDYVADKKLQVTDDASVVEQTGGRVVCVELSHANIKVTLPEDLAIAEVLMQHRLVEEGCGRDA